MFILLLNVRNCICIDETVNSLSLFLPQRRLGSTEKGFVTITMYKRDKLLSVCSDIFSSVLVTIVIGSE